jgi:Rps23 Pro-64 3,4-dihydroxylase Tpa1-like proline 4-hydroxylase
MSDNGQSHAPVVIFDEFLVAEEWGGLMQYALARNGEFDRTRIIQGDGDAVDDQYRRSRVLYDLGAYHNLFADRIMSVLPYVLARLKYPAFPVSKIEIQLTATGEGEFFRVHNDNGHNAVSTRAVTFVYFFYVEPRPFTGGELRIFDTSFENGQAKAVGPYKLIEPAQNQVVIFIPDYLHEILPVACASTDFASSRFTVNGWLHR